MRQINMNNLDNLDKWVLNLDQTNPEPACDQDCNSDNRCDTCPFREGAD